MVRPRRSVLYLPASNARAIEKARTLACDGVILDLEDAVSPDAKEAARARALAALAAGGWGRRERIVRVNALGTPWGRDDLAAIAGAEVLPDAVLVPKVDSADALSTIRRLLGRADVDLWCMIETPKGVLAAADIATADPRLSCLVAGTSDLIEDLGGQMTPDRLALLHSLSAIVLAARAAGIDALDGVALDLADQAGLAAQCAQGRTLGFTGKTLIHPSQIEPANAAFGPSPAAVDHARRVIAAYEAAVEAGKGVAVLDGKLVESLHAAAARRVLALADAIGAS
jgi:citrate lyase subunit beta/citryl-CoA lyase